MIKNYEQQILYYKKKSKFYNNKDLSISSNNTINIIPSKKQVFDYEIQSIINKSEMTKEPNNSFITLQKIYEKKIDNIFQQNSLLKSEIEEKNCEISELNTQQIEHMKEIENLNINIKNLNDSIRLMNVNISEKEKILNANSIKIQELTDKIIEKDDIIKKNEDTIQEKENEIQLLYTDNVQWEEKYSIQNSLWEQNLIESYKTIEKLESELKDEKIKKNQLNDEIHIKNVNTEFSSNISILENEIKNIKDKYDSQIINDSKNDINNIHILIENSENNLENKKKNYEKNIEEKKDKYEKEIKELNERLNNQEKNLEKLKNENEEYKNEITKKSDIFKNLKEIYENLILKVKEQEKKLQKYENPKNKSVLMDSLMDDNEIEEKKEKEENDNNNKQYSSFDKFSFTKEILIDYLLCLYLSENGITLQNIISNIMGNLNLYLSISFKDDIHEDTFNNYTNFANKTIEQDLIEDIFFLSFDKLITKKILMDGDEILKDFNDPDSLLKKYDLNLSKINFEDFDPQTLTEICYEITNKNFITRIKAPKNLDDLIKMFILKYEKKFDFDTKLNEYIQKEILPLVNKRIQNYNKIYFNEIRTLVELILHNLKNGKIYIEDKEVYSFERYFMEYNNYISLTNRNLKFEIFDNILKTEEIDNICHILKFYNPDSVSFVNCFKNLSIDNTESTIQQNLKSFYQSYGIKNAINKIFSSILLYKKNMKYFIFKENRIDSKLFNQKIFNLIKLLSNLETLDLTDNEIQDDDIKSFVSIFKVNKTIKSLNLSKNSITSNGTFYLSEAITKNEILERLNLSNNNINDSGLSSLFNTLTSNGSNLIELNLAYNNLQKEDFSSVAEFLSINPKLKILDLSGNTINAQSANIIGVTFKKNSNLNILKVNNCGFKEESISNFIFYLNESNINELELDNNSFGVMGPIIIMGKFKSCPNLKKFSLQYCEITPMFLNMIAENLKFSSSIEEVNLKYNEFEEKSFNTFCKSIEKNNKTIFKFSKDKVPSNCQNNNNKNIIFE